MNDTFYSKATDNSIRMDIDTIGLKKETIEDLKHILAPWTTLEGIELYPEWILNVEEGPGPYPKRSDHGLEGTYYCALDEWDSNFGYFARKWNHGAVDATIDLKFRAEDESEKLTLVGEGVTFHIPRHHMFTMEKIQKMLTVFPVIATQNNEKKIEGNIFYLGDEYRFSASKDNVQLTHTGEYFAPDIYEYNFSSIVTVHPPRKYAIVVFGNEIKFPEKESISFSCNENFSNMSSKERKERFFNYLVSDPKLIKKAEKFFGKIEIDEPSSVPHP